MAGRPMPFRNPARHAGLRENLTSLLGALAQFVGSRLELATREGKAALLHLVTLVACFVAAGLLVLFGYVFLMAFVIVSVAHLLGVSWIWTALAVALLHFAGALFCVIIARGQLRRPLFYDTRSVLKQDSEWLTNLNQAKRP